GVVGDHVQVGGQVLAPLQPRPGGPGARLGAGDDAADQLLAVGRVGGAHAEAAGGAGRDHVRRAAAVGDHAVDARVGAHLLAEQPDGVEHHQHGVERVDPLVRVGGGVGGPAVEREVEAV